MTRVLLSAALSVLLAAAGCARGYSRAEAGPLSDIPVYYLFPGEPAVVEGPQLNALDFEKLLDALDHKDLCSNKSP